MTRIAWLLLVLLWTCHREERRAVAPPVSAALDAGVAGAEARPAP